MPPPRSRGATAPNESLSNVCVNLIAPAAASHDARDGVRLAAHEASDAGDAGDGVEHVLLLTLHHLVSDGWSVAVLAEELSALYAAFRRGAADPLPALAVQ